MKKGSFVNKFKPYLFIAPAFLLIAYWLYRPLLENIQLSFYDWNMVPGTEKEYVGFDNFIQLFNHKDLPIAIRNTLFYMVTILPFSLIIPIIVSAATQNLNRKAQVFYRTLMFVPMMISPVAASVVFQWLLHPTNGLINHVSMNLGLIDDNISFFSDAFWARVCITMISGWKIMGFATLLFSSGIGNIDKRYYEAAKLDGAGKFKMFFTLTLPLLSPTIMLMLMLSVLFSSQWTFAYIDVLTSGGPFGQSTNLYYIMYDFAFANSNVGLSAAASLVFLIIFGIIALILQYFNRKLSFYDN